MNRHNRIQAAQSRGVCRQTLSKRFRPFFLRSIPQSVVWDLFPPKLSREWVLGLDGKWLRREGVILIYRNVTNNEDLWWNFWPSESYSALITDLQEIYFRTVNNLPAGAVSDWKGSLVNGVAMWFHDIPHQRCLAHVVRDMKKLLPKSSPIFGTRELRKIGVNITQVRSSDDLETWRLWLTCWEVFYGELLRERSYPLDPKTSKKKWWYTHSNIRRAFQILTKDQDCLFEYLNHPHIPNTNNSLEGLNSDIKTKLANHRGMKHWQQYCFVQWYLAFRKVKNPEDLRKLWAEWKKIK